jgi:molybdate transport system ATP-binding protein
VLVGEPRVLLLDEPTRGLDNRLKAAFYDVLRQMQKRSDIPVLLVTHDLDECFELADSVCLMDGGRLLQAGNRDAVFAKPASVEVARRLGIYNIVSAEITALDPGRNTSRLAVFDGFLEAAYLPGHLIGDHGSVCVREHEVRVRAAKSGSARNQLMLPVNETTGTATGIRIHFHDDFCAVVSDSEWHDLRGNEALWVEIPPSAVHFIG